MSVDFGTHLYNHSTCNDLRLMVRSMGIRAPTRMKKSELVTLVLEEIQEPTKEETVTMIRRAGDNPTNDTLLRTIKRMSQTFEKVANLKFERMECEFGTRRPKYGKRGSSDCDDGFTRVNGKGCCVPIDQAMKGIWNLRSMEECKGACRSPQDRALLTKFVSEAKKDEKEYAALVGGTKFLSEDQAKFVKGVADRFRHEMVKKIANFYEDVQSMAGGDEVCDLSEASLQELGRTGIPLSDGISAIMRYAVSTGTKIATGVKRAAGAVADAGIFVILGVFKVLWYLMRTLFGWTYGVVKKTFGVIKYVGGKAVTVSLTLATEAQKVAYFIMQSPRQARMAFYFANKLKAKAGEYIATKLSQSTILKRMEEYYSRRDRRRGIDSYEQYRAGIFSAISKYSDDGRLRRYEGNTSSLMQKVGISFSGALETSGVTPVQRENERPDKDGWADRAYKASKGVYDTADALGGVSGSMEALAKSKIVTKFTANAGRWAGQLAGGMLSSLPGGGVLAAGTQIFGEMIGNMTGETLEKALEFEAYNHDVSGAFDEFMNLMNPTPFLVKMTVIERRYPHLWWRLAAGVVVGSLVAKYGLDIMKENTKFIGRAIRKIEYSYDIESELNEIDSRDSRDSRREEDLDLTPRG